MKRTFLSLLAIVLLSLPAAMSFFHPGFMVSDDGAWMVIRLAAFYDALRDGQLPVRWVNTLNFGYGYPVTHFLYPGFLYIGAPIALIVSDFALTIKILFIASILLGPIGMYLWLSKKFGVFASIVGSLIYVYAPYHLFTTVMRGSLGEVFFLAIVPFLFWAIQEKRKFLTTLLFGLLLLSHNTLALLFLPIVLSYALLLRKDISKNAREGIMPLVLGVGISLFFWVPALVDLSATRFLLVSISDFSRYFATISLIGISSLLIMVTATIVFLRQKKVRYLSVEGFMILVALVTLFMSTHLSQQIWSLLPVSFVQFPFRFLAVTVFTLAYLGAFAISRLRYKIVIGVCLAVLMLVGSWNYLSPKDYSDHPDTYYSTNQSTTTIKNEYMPIAVSHDPVPDTNSPVISTGSIRSSTITSNMQAFSTQSQESATLSIGQLYFPGWEVRVDGIVQKIHVVKDSGIMQVDLNPGDHQVVFSFKETGVRLFADIISFVSLVTAVWLYGVKKYAKR